VTRIQVIQSHRQPMPADWYQPCVDSVRAWSQRCGYDYLWLDDSMLQMLPEILQLKTARQPVVAADLGRLRALQRGLDEGFDRVVWIDADTLIIDPERLALPDDDHLFGREIWIQYVARGNEKILPGALSPDRLRVYDKIHNAFMCFSQGNPFLDFYSYAAERLVSAHQGPMVSQFVGPKFLATLNNLLNLPVLEEAAVLCPLVARDLLADQDNGAALQLFRRHSLRAPAALNLCGSLVSNKEVSNEELSSADMHALIALLVSDEGSATRLLQPVGQH
jgi:hypothetical protein